MIPVVAVSLLIFMQEYPTIPHITKHSTQSGGPQYNIHEFPPTMFSSVFRFSYPDQAINTKILILVRHGALSP